MKVVKAISMVFLLVFGLAVIIFFGAQFTKEPVYQQFTVVNTNSFAIRVENKRFRFQLDCPPLERCIMPGNSAVDTPSSTTVYRLDLEQPVSIQPRRKWNRSGFTFSGRFRENFVEY